MKGRDTGGMVGWGGGAACPHPGTAQVFLLGMGNRTRAKPNLLLLPLVMGVAESRDAIGIAKYANLPISKEISVALCFVFLPFCLV